MRIRSVFVFELNRAKRALEAGRVAMAEMLELMPGATLLDECCSGVKPFLASLPGRGFSRLTELALGMSGPVWMT